LLLRIDPATPVGSDVAYVLPAGEHRRGMPFFSLLADGRAWGTSLLWIVNFMNLLNIYLLQGWLTTFIAAAGVPQETAAMIAAMVQVGGVIGAFSLGAIVYRLGFAPVLLVCGLLASANIALIGQPWMTSATLFITVFIAGFCVVGGQSAINTLAASYYPTELRSSGIGAGLGVGRVGAIVGPLLVSWFTLLGWTDASIFMAAAVPPLILAVAMAFWSRLARPRSVDLARDQH
jgi:AAHS family 4-hydroxybenzoate transporter-like MFS transporter